MRSANLTSSHENARSSKSLRPREARGFVLVTLEAPELDARAPHGLVTRQTGADEILDASLDMETKLLVHFGLYVGAVP